MTKYLKGDYNVPKRRPDIFTPHTDITPVSAASLLVRVRVLVVRDVYMLGKGSDGEMFEERSYTLEKGVPWCLATGDEHEPGEDCPRHSVGRVAVVDRHELVPESLRKNPKWKWRSLFSVCIKVDPMVCAGGAIGRGPQTMETTAQRKCVENLLKLQEWSLIEQAINQGHPEQQSLNPSCAATNGNRDRQGKRESKSRNNI